MRRSFSSSFKHFIVLPVLTMLAVSLVVLNVEAAEKPLIDLGAELDAIKKTEQAKQVGASPAVVPESKVKKVEPGDEKPGHGPYVGVWSYSGPTGPRYWHKLSDEYATCGTGKNQSPIDLRDAKAIGTQGLASLDIAYKAVPLKITDNDHSLQVNFPLGSYIKVGGHRYELLQYHFHTPSEHHKEGFAYPMEMHLVHKDGDGNIAIIGILFQEGEANPHLNGLLKRLPKTKGKQEIHNDLKLNPVNFLPSNTEFYKYSGSTTAPPCSEGVYWMVFKHPIEASAEQIIQMNELMGENARPVQELFARDILKSWSESNEESLMYEFY